MNTTDKKQIALDWLNIFPQLTLVGKNKLLKIIGPFIIGIELFHHQRLGEAYIPYFVCYSLNENNEKTCLSAPFILRAIRDKKNLQFSIPYQQHSTSLEEAYLCAKEQINIPLEGDVRLNLMLSMIKHEFTDPFTTKNTVQQSFLYYLKFILSLYSNDKILLNETFNEINKSKDNWPSDLFVWQKYGNRDSWFENLQQSINHREIFLEQIEKNRQDPKLKKLHVSEIIL